MTSQKMLLSACIILLIVLMANSRPYPMFKQCDPEWGSLQYDSSTETICQGGSLLSSIAMGLAGTGLKYNPGTLNQWLKANNGY